MFHLFNNRNSFFSVCCIDSFIRILYDCFSFYMMLENLFMYFDKMTKFFLLFLFVFFLLLLNLLQANNEIFSLFINPFSYWCFFLIVLILKLFLFNFSFLSTWGFFIFVCLSFNHLSSPIIEMWILRWR